MKNESLWINNLLKEVQANPEFSCLLERCGEACARNNGHIDAIKKYSKAAFDCKTRSDYVELMKKSFPLQVEEARDGIVIRFHKSQCSCPLASEVSNPALCHCTVGHEKAMWSVFWGKQINVEILESQQRGGSDCVIKLFV